MTPLVILLALTQAGLLLWSAVGLANVVLKRRPGFALFSGVTTLALALALVKYAANVDPLRVLCSVPDCLILTLSVACVRVLVVSKEEERLLADHTQALRAAAGEGEEGQRGQPAGQDPDRLGGRQWLEPGRLRGLAGIRCEAPAAGSSRKSRRRSRLGPRGGVCGAEGRFCYTTIKKQGIYPGGLAAGSAGRARDAAQSADFCEGDQTGPDLLHGIMREGAQAMVQRVLMEGEVVRALQDELPGGIVHLPKLEEADLSIETLAGQTFGKINR